MSDKPTNPKDLLRYHVSGAIERGEATPIVGIPATPEDLERLGFSPGAAATPTVGVEPPAVGITSPESSGASALACEIVDRLAQCDGLRDRFEQGDPVGFAAGLARSVDDVILSRQVETFVASWVDRHGFAARLDGIRHVRKPADLRDALFSTFGDRWNSERGIVGRPRGRAAEARMLHLDHVARIAGRIVAEIEANPQGTTPEQAGRRPIGGF